MHRRRILLAAAVIFGIAAVVGAVLDWFWWPVYNGIVITLAAGAILIVAIVLAVVPRTRSAALIVAAAGVGLIAGQNLGPSRPALEQSEGTVTVTLTAPHAATGTHTATCSMDASGADFQVSGDPNLRVDVLPDDPSVPADIDQREFFGVSLTIGDRWNQGRTPRADDVALLVIVGSVAAKDPETRMSSAPTSTLEVTRSGSGGELSFSGLVPQPDAGQPAGEPIDLAGTLAWECASAEAAR